MKFIDWLGGLLFSLFCRHQWRTTEEFALSNGLDTILIQTCQKCGMEKGKLMIRPGFFKVPYCLAKMSAQTAREKIEQLKELYKIECERDWIPMEGEDYE